MCCMSFRFAKKKLWKTMVLFLCIEIVPFSMTQTRVMARKMNTFLKSYFWLSSLSKLSHTCIFKPNMKPRDWIYVIINMWYQPRVYHKQDLSYWASDDSSIDDAFWIMFWFKIIIRISFFFLYVYYYCQSYE